MTLAPPSHVSDTAILFADWTDIPLTNAPLGLPNDLLPLLDKPMLQRAVEQLARLNCRNIIVVLGEQPLPYKDFLGTGEHWGCELTYLNLQPNESPLQLLTRLKLKSDQHYWLANSIDLPDAGSLAACASLPAAKSGGAACWEAQDGLRWSGWGLFVGAWLMYRQAPLVRGALTQTLQFDSQIECCQGDTPLRVETLADHLNSNQRLIGMEGRPELSLGRGCSIHPSAHIVPPAYIGAHVRIGADAIIGPHSVICDGAIIGDAAHVLASVVLPDTYVGENLDLIRVIVRGNRLANISIDTLVEVVDKDVLSHLPSADAYTSSMEKWLARGLRLALAPMQYISLKMTRGTESLPRAQAHVTLPRPGQIEPDSLFVKLTLPREIFITGHSKPWARHFSHTFYPGLTEIIQGNIRFAGPTLRAIQEVRQLPDDWRRIYGEARCGLLNDGITQYVPDLSLDEQFACDALAYVQQNRWRDKLTLLRRYLRKVFLDLAGISKPPPRLTQDSSSPDLDNRSNSSHIHHRTT